MKTLFNEWTYKKKIQKKLSKEKENQRKKKRVKSLNNIKNDSLYLFIK